LNLNLQEKAYLIYRFNVNIPTYQSTQMLLLWFFNTLNHQNTQD